MPNKNSSNHFSSCISSSTTNQVFIEGKVHWYSFKSHITTLFMSDGVAGLVPSNLERVSVRLSMKLLHWIPSYIFFVAVHKQSLSSSKNIVFLLSYLKSDLWATSSSCSHLAERKVGLNELLKYQIRPISILKIVIFTVFI